MRSWLKKLKSGWTESTMQQKVAIIGVITACVCATNGDHLIALGILIVSELGLIEERLSQILNRMYD